MINCTNCGTQNNDTATFCGACGNTLGALQQTPAPFNGGAQNGAPMGGQPQYGAPQGEQYGAPMQNTQYGAYQGEQHGAPGQNGPYGAYQGGQYGTQPPYYNPNTLIALKKLCSSTLFLVTAIILTSGIVLNSLSTLIINPTGSLGLLPGGLTIAGIWLIYAYGKNMQSNSTQGLTLIKASLIITLVIMFMAVGVVLLLWAFFGVLATEIMGEFGTGVVAAVFIFLLIIFAIGIAFYFVAIKCVNSIKKTIVTGIAHHNGVTFVSVVFFIVAAFGVLSSFSSLMVMDSSMELITDYLVTFAASSDVPLDLDSLDTILEPGPLTLVAPLLQNAGTFMLGLLLSKYRKEVK